MRLNNVHIESLMDPGSLKVKKGFFFYHGGNNKKIKRYYMGSK